MTEAIHEAIAAKLQQAQSRYTRSRRALVDVLILAGNPMSVEQIVADAVTLPRPSVYRNLVVLQNCGVVRSIAGPDEFTRYELDEHLTGHHHHLGCRSCGIMIDVELPVELERQIDQTTHALAKQRGFLAEDHRLDVIAVCPACQSNQKAVKVGPTPPSESAPSSND